MSMKDTIYTFVWPAIAGLLAAVLILDRWALQQPLLPSYTGQLVGYRQAVSRATPAVVNIYTAKLVPEQARTRFNDPLLRRFGESGRRRASVERSLGSGVIMTAEGHILTNNHVIAEADAIQVLLSDGRSISAAVIGSDPETDLAVLKIDLPNLTPIEVADSNLIGVGDIVLAIGNPFGFGHSVSQGIVSGLGRYGLQLSTYEDYIQTDASIHQGNSGGALIDTEGKLVGINTLIYTSVGEAGGESSGIGINLATPSNLAFFVMQDLIEYGRVVRGWLGVSVDLVFGLDEAGQSRQSLLITALAEDGPAQRAGIQAGDVIITIDGEPISDGREAMHRIARMRPGEGLSVGVVREDQMLSLNAVVGTRASVN